LHVKLTVKLTLTLNLRNRIRMLSFWTKFTKNYYRFNYYYYYY